MSQHFEGTCPMLCRVIGCTNLCDGSAGFRHYCGHHRAGPQGDRAVGNLDGAE